MAKVEFIKAETIHTLEELTNEFLEKNPTAVPVSHAVAVEESRRTQTIKEYSAMILLP